MPALNPSYAALTTTHVLKASSANFKCAVFDDTATANTLQTYHFTGGSTSATAVTAALFSGITIASASYAVPDDCSGLRINDKILRLDGAAYVNANLPTNVTTLANPAFS